MIESVHFQNFKALRDATVPLGRFTLLIGPNGSGKSSVLQGLQMLRIGANFGVRYLYAGVAGSPSAQMRIEAVMGRDDSPFSQWTAVCKWSRDPRDHTNTPELRKTGPGDGTGLQPYLDRIRMFSLDSRAIAQPSRFKTTLEMRENGEGLAGYLDHLNGRYPELWESIIDELHRWLPQYDRILLLPVSDTEKTFALRTSGTRYEVRAEHLSQGELLAMAMLTLAYLPKPPTVVALEEPDRGIHPRLLRDVQDALYRLSHPEAHGVSREPVQVIVTTHSPYMLDLYRDHPEEVVVADRMGDNIQFTRMDKLPNFEEIMHDTPSLGSAWYTGILGGVPATS